MKFKHKHLILNLDNTKYKYNTLTLNPEDKRRDVHL